MKVIHFGWPIAAALIAVVVATGFEDPVNKTGVADLGKIFQDSDFAHQVSEDLRQKGDARSSVLEFMNTYKVFLPEQAVRFRELSLLANPSVAEKAELEKLKQDVMGTNKRLLDLQTKPNPTPAEVAIMQDFNTRAQTTTKTIERWAREFDDELNTLMDKNRTATIDRVRKAIKQVGLKKGYTIIFTRDAAPYGANDITADALKAMNANK